MKGIGFGGHQVSTKNRFHAENSKVLLKGIHFGDILLYNNWLHIENIFHKGIYFGDIVSNKKGSMLTTSLT